MLILDLSSEICLRCSILNESRSRELTSFGVEFSFLPRRHFTQNRFRIISPAPGLLDIFFFHQGNFMGLQDIHISCCTLKPNDKANSKSE